jgi:23S rRNA-/tRNA-specific pseudouridylate synthase
MLQPFMMKHLQIHPVSGEVPFLRQFLTGAGLSHRWKCGLFLAHVGNVYNMYCMVTGTPVRIIIGGQHYSIRSHSSGASAQMVANERSILLNEEMTRLALVGLLGSRTNQDNLLHNSSLSLDQLLQDHHEKEFEKNHSTYRPTHPFSVDKFQNAFNGKRSTLAKAKVETDVKAVSPLSEKELIKAHYDFIAPLVVYEDSSLIAIRKPAGFAVGSVRVGNSASSRESSRLPMQSMIANYLKHKYEKRGECYVGIVQNLETAASGLVVFTRDSKTTAVFNRHMNGMRAKLPTRSVFDKSYLGLHEDDASPTSRDTHTAVSSETSSAPILYVCLVEGHITAQQGKLVHGWVYSAAENSVHINNKQENPVDDQVEKKRSRATLCYEALSRHVGEDNKPYTLVKITYASGHWQQIRAQLAEMGHPVVGDDEFRSKSNIMGSEMFSGVTPNLPRAGDYDSYASERTNVKRQLLGSTVGTIALHCLKISLPYPSLRRNGLTGHNRRVM